MDFEMSSIYVIFSILAFMVILVSLLKPFKALLKIIINSIMGFGVLIASNFILESAGITLGVNIMNAIIIGILGLPGLGALIIIDKFFL